MLLRRWRYPALLGHLRYDFARDHGGLLCDFLVCDGVALAPAMVRVAAGGDEEGEVDESVRAGEVLAKVMVPWNWG